MKTSLPTVDTVLGQVDRSLDQNLEKLFALLRIPSISTQPNHAGDCRKAAAWLAAELASLGLDAAVRESRGLPMVVAHDREASEGPHVLFYGHYDVQPVDPPSLWTRPPFDPALVESPNGDRWITGRGASDDKGQVMTFISALRALRDCCGRLPVRVSILLEGEEECGGPSLRPFMDEHNEELRADYALVCDTSMIGDIPTVTTALRGLVGEEIIITCANRDLHSGLFGGAARNPLHLLVEILASLRDAQGRVTLPGFYDGVEPPSDVTRKAWRQLGLGDAELLGPVGLANAAGEVGFTGLEQTWCRPTCEINGITGGYAEEGFKTVLPAQASAKVSFRMVAGQNPQAVRRAFREHVRARIPADCSVSFKDHGASRASRVTDDSLPVQAALAALTQEWERQAVLVASGGSIPVVHDLRHALGMDTLLVGFAQADDRVHSPNEKYDLRSFHKGTRSWARILMKLAEGRAA